MNKNLLKQLIKEEIESIKISNVIDHLNNKMKEYNTPEGENEYNDGVRRGLALAIVNLNKLLKS
jgi:hypothetical protein